jgi:drug/metabolite transporter (DMT)-like permease
LSHDIDWTTLLAQLNTFFLTALAILAFAGNSVLTRLALAESQIGAAEFTAIRLLSGALMLVMLCGGSWRQSLPTREDATGTLCLFVYAISFTLAYLNMSAATGALILFAMVQLTMIGLANAKGLKMNWLESAGVALAFAGLAWLLLPNATSPPVHAAALMALAGVAWGIYTIDGRGAASPLQKTARNIVGACGLGIFPMFLMMSTKTTFEGLVLAIASGAITSGLGYAVWYRVLPRISVAMAGTSQLAVPMVAAAGGAMLIGEALTARLLIGGAVILAGVALTVLGKSPAPVTMQKPHEN